MELQGFMERQKIPSYFLNVTKTKAGASLYLTGIGKVKTRLTLPGKSSNISYLQDKCDSL